MADCIRCGRPLRLTTEKEVAALECSGIHIYEPDPSKPGIPVRSKGLMLGTNVVMEKVEYGTFCRVGSFSDLFRCRLGDGVKIGSHVVIEGDVVVGSFSKVKAFSFIAEGTRIGQGVFLGPHSMALNDLHPRALGEWKPLPAKIEDFASVGAGTLINPGVTLGRSCMVGSGSVVTKDIPSGEVWAGNPARPLR